MSFAPLSRYDVFSVLSNHLAAVKEEIRHYDNQTLLRSSSTELETYFIGKTLLEPLTLHTDQCHSDEPISVRLDARYDRERFFFPHDDVRPRQVQGTELVINIPYDGDQRLWEVRPSRFTVATYPEIDVGTDNVSFPLRFADDRADAPETKQRLDHFLHALNDTVRNLRRDIEQHNAQAPDEIRDFLERKREQALAAINAVSSLGIPIKKRDQPATYIAPVRRRPLPIIRPASSAQAYEPEPTLEEAAYSHILGVICSASLVMERDPKSFATLGEEALRALLLLLINGHYEGAATGETFNGEGKTDILIRVNDRNIFIAECKIWSGQAKFMEAVDQLLGYLTWRDCKCALIVFSRQKDAMNVAEKMHEAMTAHKGHRKCVNHDLKEGSRYVFVKESDPGREIILTTQLFHVSSA